MQTPSSNVDSSLVIGAIVHYRSGVRYRHCQLIEENVNVQSNAVSSAICSRLKYCPKYLCTAWCQTRHKASICRLDLILLTTVCRRWREVALDSPRLWCKLQLEFRFKEWRELPATPLAQAIKSMSTLAETCRVSE
ncbi:hypothetical protein BDR04DRAFT_292309 [Suillus decipiens]|nr:hypothetical protein BDR04DRAFT_292309 [Suillus decipiens]